MNRGKSPAFFVLLKNLIPQYLIWYNPKKSKPIFFKYKNIFVKRKHKCGYIMVYKLQYMKKI